MIDIKDIISIALGTSFGGLVSWLVTRHYWLKGKPVENITRELRQLNTSIFSGLRTVLVFDRNPQYFSADAQLMEISPAYESTKIDVPQIEWCRVPSNIVAGGTFTILMKVVDLGMNFENPSGATITDHRGGRVTAQNAGFGCMFATITTLATDQGKLTFTIKLVDGPDGGALGNSCTQHINFFVRK